VTLAAKGYSEQRDTVSISQFARREGFADGVFFATVSSMTVLTVVMQRPQFRLQPRHL
jgi:hypothetical protein